MFRIYILLSCLRINNTDDDDEDNNNNCYIALYFVNIYELEALYIINIKIHLTIKQSKMIKSTSTVNAYITINMIKCQDDI